jgi:hypothetical protein
MGSLHGRALATGLAVGIVSTACGDRSLHAPISAEAARVRYAEAPFPGCTRLGRARGIGTDPDERVAGRRALDAAREKAAELGGDLIVGTDRKLVPDADSGSMTRVEQAVEVYQCGSPIEKGR